MEEKKTVQNEVKEVDPRFVRRLKLKKQETLDTIVNLFFTHRSDLKDLEGEEADALFVKYRNMWIAECKAFNRINRRPFTLRGDAFADSVNKILEMEKIQNKKLKEEKEEKDFKEWFKEYGGWANNFFRSLWFWVKSFGDGKKQQNVWKHYYISTL